MAKTATKGYKVTVEGEYYAHTPSGQIIKRYEVDVNLPKLTDDEGNSVALYQIKNYLLAPLLRKKYEDYSDFRTHEITNVVDLQDPDETPDDISHMSRKQLTKLIERKNYPIHAEIFNTVTDLRQAIIDYKDDPDSYKKREENKKHANTRMMEEAATRSELAALNPGLFEDDEL